MTTDHGRRRSQVREVALSICIGVLAASASARSTRFEVAFSAPLRAEPLTGRLVLIVAKARQPEPRLTISPSGPALFGVDLHELEPGEVVVVDGEALGYPLPLSRLPVGDYFVQAVVNVYERVKRADGHELWLPMNDGTQETFGIRAGNLVSEPLAVHLDGNGSGGGATQADVVVNIDLARVLPPRARPLDTEWVKHVTIESRKLTDFWGRPTFVHATVLLPRGHAEHPNLSYPCLYTLGHNVPFAFATDPSRAAERGALNATTGLESGYDFCQSWIADDFPRVVAISFEQQTPFFPDSYSVNSASNGPYGDAIVDEVIPALEARFRLIREPYARHVEGASTGGWSALALQLQHPDEFGGAWVLQPDPIDFRRYQQVDLYADANAFEIPLGPFGKVERPFRRSVEGQPIWTVRQMSLFEEVLGTRGRSGWQLSGWEAVFAPLDSDGYPRPLWNKLTGAIDHDVAASMREHGYDLCEYTRVHWATLGPKLAGKLHFFAGDMDDFYLNLAVYRFEEFLKSTTDPVSDAAFTYGRPMKGHSWHAFPWSEFVRRVAASIERAAARHRAGGG